MAIRIYTSLLLEPLLKSLWSDKFNIKTASMDGRIGTRPAQTIYRGYSEERVAYLTILHPGFTEVCVLDGESFIGGFASGFLARGFHIGYGLYFTSQRLIGIDLGKNGGGALGGSLAGFIEGQLMPRLSEEEGAHVIAQLEQMKEFDLTKDQIDRIELRKPGLLGSGHIVISSTAGNSVKISLRHRTAYDRLLTLTQAFSPGLVKLS